MRNSWLTSVSSVLLTAIVLVRSSWGFTIARLYVIQDLVAAPAVLAMAAPQAFASATTMTAGMYAADAGVVRESYEKYNDAVVNVMNIFLAHGVP
jgi:hypothetical protein